MHGRQISLVLFLLLAVGCSKGIPEENPAPPLDRVQDSRSFDVQNTSTIQGKVMWEGAMAEAPALAGNVPTTSEGGFERIVKANPNAPLVDPATRGVRDAVVFLRGVNAKASRPWDLPAVTIEQHDMELRIRQGAISRVGFVKAGTNVSAVSKDKYFHSLRARGVAFFSLPFVEPDKPGTRAFTNKGLVELSSGAGYTWMRAFLFIDDHPYYVRTGAKGTFVLTEVPAGKYELVCWMPNWHIARRELDPESSQASRITFHAPIEIAREVVVRRGESKVVDFTVSESRFKK